MPCNKPNCCRAKGVETKLQMKATAELQEQVEKDLQETDGSIAELLEKQEDGENEDEDKDTGAVS